MLRYESQAVRKFHHVIAVSEHDRSLMETWVEGSRITVVPTGVDLEQYKPDFSNEPAAPIVMFVGAMDWEPNIDGMATSKPATVLAKTVRCNPLDTGFMLGVKFRERLGYVLFTSLTG